MSRVLIVCGILAVICVDLIVVTELGAAGRIVMFVPSLLVLLVSLGKLRLAWMSGAVAGVLLDTFSLFPPGTHTAALIALVGIVQAMFLRWFTNRSFLSFAALVSVGVLFYSTLLFIIRAGSFFLSRDPLYQLSGTVVWQFFRDSLFYNWVVFVGGFIVALSARKVFGRQFFIRLH